DDRDDGASEPLVQSDRIADVVAVSVRQEDEVAALGLDLRLRTSRIALEERIEVDALPARRVDPKRRVPEPGQLRRHGAKSRERESRPGGDPPGRVTAASGSATGRRTCRGSRTASGRSR